MHYYYHCCRIVTLCIMHEACSSVCCLCVGGAALTDNMNYIVLLKYTHKLFFVCTNFSFQLYIPIAFLYTLSLQLGSLKLLQQQQRYNNCTKRVQNDVHDSVRTLNNMRNVLALHWRLLNQFRFGLSCEVRLPVSASLCNLFLLSMDHCWPFWEPRSQLFFILLFSPIIMYSSLLVCTCKKWLPYSRWMGETEEVNLRPMIFFTVGSSFKLVRLLSVLN